MDEKIAELRYKAFEDEVRLAITSLNKADDSGGVVVREILLKRLGSYLKYYFINYMDWRWVVSEDTLHFNISVPNRLHAYGFKVSLL